MLVRMLTHGARKKKNLHDVTEISTEAMRQKLSSGIDTVETPTPHPGRFPKLIAQVRQFVLGVLRPDACLPQLKQQPERDIRESPIVKSMWHLSRTHAQHDRLNCRTNKHLPPKENARLNSRAARVDQTRVRLVHGSDLSGQLLMKEYMIHSAAGLDSLCCKCGPTNLYLNYRQNQLSSSRRLLWWLSFLARALSFYRSDI